MGGGGGGGSGRENGGLSPQVSCVTELVDTINISTESFKQIYFPDFYC